MSLFISAQLATSRVGELLPEHSPFEKPLLSSRPFPCPSIIIVVVVVVLLLFKSRVS